MDNYEIVAPVFAPIDDSGHLNLSIIPEYIKYLANHDVTTVLVGGTTGESVTLSLDERKQLLETWMKAAEPLGTRVISQIGGVPLPEVVEMARFSEEKQVSGIMTLPEIYYKPKSSEQVVAYLATVSRAAPTLPLLYYHFPMMSGVELNVPEFFSMASSRIANFKGMKADLGVAVQVTDLLRDDQRIYIGNHMLAPAVLLGHESSIATVTNMFPRLSQDIVAATKRGEVSKVRELQNRMNRLVSAIASQGEFLPAMKAAMEMVTGIKVGPPRQPMAALDQGRRTNVEESLRKLDVDIVG